MSNHKTKNEIEFIRNLGKHNLHNDNGLLKDEKKKEDVVYTPRVSTSEENKIFIKPLSVNECWKGKRYKTDKYSNYEDAMLDCLMVL